jgi:hypothetical protein
VGVERARLHVVGERIDYDRGRIVEWYANTERGLEQGFTLNRPPARGRSIALDLANTGTLVPRVSSDGQAVEFADPKTGRQLLHFASLHAFDAEGRSLPSRFQALDRPGVHGLRILVDDLGAAYPITVDPLLTSAAWYNEGNQAQSQFGYSVAPAGDVNGDGYADLVVGQFGYDGVDRNTGRALLYLGTPSGLQTTASWTAESDLLEARFGNSVAGAGDVNGDGYDDVIVGAYQYGPDTNDGRAYVFLGSASGLSPTAAWIEDSEQLDAGFGISVAGAGDVNNDGFDDVVIGAYHYDNGQTNEGKAYVYLGSASGLAATPVWAVESNQAVSHFGFSVDGAGDVNGDGFDDVVVGAYLWDNGQTDEGRAFVYLGSASGPATTPAWTAESDQASALFGYSVAGAGDVNGDSFADVAVGATSYDSGNFNEGGGFVYHGSATGLSLTPNWTGGANQDIAQFGDPLAAAGDVDGDGYDDLIVGAFLYDNDQVDDGRAYVFGGSPAGLKANPIWVVQDNQAGSTFGFSVASAGDVNGDGFDDVAVGAPESSGDLLHEGRAFVYLGGAGLPGPGRITIGSLRLAKAGGGQITLSWGPSCLGTATDYEIYEGALGSFASYGSLFCTTAGATSKTLTPGAGSRFYLVVPRTASVEGSYGDGPAGAERPVGANACFPRVLGGCQ